MKLNKIIQPIRNAILTSLGVPVEITQMTVNDVVSLLGGGTSSSSGKRVSVDSVLQLSAAWACVRLISETVSTLPLKVYQKNSDGSRTLAVNHNLYSVLCKNPHYEYTPSRFMLMLVASICLWGNSYNELIRLKNGKIVSIQPLLPQSVTVKRLENGKLEYNVYENGKVRKIDEKNMMHIRGFGIDGLSGLSPVSKGKETFGSATSAEQSAGKFFQKGMQPSGFLSTETTLNAEQREKIGENVNRFAFSENAGRIMVLEAGMSYHNITMNPESAQLLETRSFNVEEICRWFRVAPHMIGHVTKTSSWASSTEGLYQNFLTNTLRPLLVNIEQEIARCLISRHDTSISVEFSVEGLLRADSKGRSEYYQSALNNGWMSRNEVRKLENLPPISGGDIYTVQSALINIADVGKNYGELNE